MRLPINRTLACFLFLALLPLYLHAQERVATLGFNPALTGANPPQARVTALTLPFFEDFTDYRVYPDGSRWTDREVYLNNTMGRQPISRGVATFDALDEHGQPYRPNNNNSVGFADSLTSQPFDFSVRNPGDSIYLSFFYQPQGNGFAPETQDSLLLLFLNKSGTWVRQWRMPGRNADVFRQVMIPVRDTNYFFDGFQFRFVNISSININDDVWNIDYIRMSANRNQADTFVSDIATSSEPGFLLNDYTFMPYRQYAGFAAQERAASFMPHFRNNNETARGITYGRITTEENHGAQLSAFSAAATIPARTDQGFTVPVYTEVPPAGARYERRVLETRFYCSAQPSPDVRENDTLLQRQVFDNYLAYDDGTAEKSYFLNLFPTLPGKIAIDFHLNQPDTLRGISIFFGRQVPLPFQKLFSVVVYRDIAFNGGTDQVVFQQDLLQPGYADSMNQFWNYSLDQPVVLPAGNFYLGITQPALSGSDSLYYGLDVNRTGGNHLYFNDTTSHHT